MIYRNIKELIASLKLSKEPNLYEALARVDENLIAINELLKNPKFDKIELGEIVFPDDTNDLTKRSALTQCCRIFNSATQTIADAVTTTCIFDTEIFDTDRLFDSVISNTQIVINTAGYYLIGATVRWNANAVGARTIRITKNAGNTIAWSIVAPTAVATVQSVMTLYKFTRGDYIELLVLQTSGGNLDIGSNAEYSPIFWVHRES